MGSQNKDEFGTIVTSKSPEANAALNTSLYNLLGMKHHICRPVTKALKHDKDFLLGWVLEGMIDSFDTPSSHSKRALKECKRLLASSNAYTERERLHVQALELFSSGSKKEGSLILEKILAKHPSDVIALKFVNDFYLWGGDSVNIRNSIARVYDYWTDNLSSSKAYGYVQGMFAFGHEETNNYRKAEELALSALDRNSDDTWAIHCVAHVMEMEARAWEGIEFLESRSKDWRDSALAPHNYWHQALLYMNFEKWEEVLDLYDRHMAPRSNHYFVLDDSSSLLFRLDAEGVDIGDRAEKAAEKWNAHSECGPIFHQLHYLLSAISSHHAELFERIQQKMERYTQSTDIGPDIRKLATEVGVPLTNALVDYGNGKYSTAVEKILPLRSDIHKIGGSHAQRDVFDILLYQSAMKSQNSVSPMNSRRRGLVYGIALSSIGSILVMQKQA